MEKEAIRSMIDNILANKEADALNDFNVAVAEKLTDSLDNKKQEIAAGLGENSVADKLMGAAKFVGDIVTGEAGKKAAEEKFKKDKEDTKKSETQPKK